MASEQTVSPAVGATVIQTLTTHEWMERLRALPEANPAGVLAFYDHRLGVIVRDARCALVPIDDHLVHRGDGVFEHMRYHERMIINLDAHLDRLRRSAEGLAIEAPCAWDEVRAIMLAVAAASGRDAGALRILIGRGQGGFGLDPAECPRAGLYVAAHTLHSLPEELFTHGVTACRSEIPVKPAVLARLKTTNYLPNVLMTLEATRRGVDFSFSFDDDGFLAEAALANVALVDASGVLVLPEFRNALPGTTSRKAAELAAAFMPVVWRPVPEADMLTARELFMLGTAHESLGVVRYEGHTIGDGQPGPVTRRLRSLLREALRREGVAF